MSLNYDESRASGAARERPLNVRRNSGTIGAGERLTNSNDSEQPVARMVLELLRTPNVSARCLNTAMKTHIHRAEN